MQPPDDLRAEDGLLPISALQHYLFCPRQCALIHVEQIWADDAATADGRVVHERVDAGQADRRAGVRSVRGLVLRSLTHGLAGKADVVELAGDIPYPVEYKRGRPKVHRADEIQLCAQALCLEEMFGVAVPEGALFYAATKKRAKVAIDAQLRALTLATARHAAAMLAAGTTPPPVAKPACRRCSLHNACQPDRLQKPPPVQAWLVRQLDNGA